MSRIISTHLVAQAGLQPGVVAVDSRSPVHGSHHVYQISWGEYKALNSVTLNFQKGPVAEVGPNGISMEALISICADRLEGFQKGAFPCDENEEALLHLKKANDALKRRTINRVTWGSKQYD